MVKLPTKLNLDRQKKRSTIQTLSFLYPETINVEIADMIGVSSVTVAKWKM